MTPLTHSPLRRFVADGLRDTIDSYTTGELPLHRFAWELDTRLRTLAELTALPEWRVLAALHEAQHTIATVDTDLRWRLLQSLVAHGVAGEAQIAAEQDHPAVDPHAHV